MSESKQVTPWFAYGTRPAREGWYEIDTTQFGNGSRNFRYWNGARWSLTYGPEYVERNGQPPGIAGGYDKSKWRGLTRPAT